jgi:hypothetical protein
LALISLIGWIVFEFVGNLANSGHSKAELRGLEAESKAWDEQQDTSAEHTKIPKSVWDKRVAWAAQHHCWFLGMNHDELIKALGKPTKEEVHDTYSSLFWAWQTKDCIRYGGDTCAEYRREEQHIDLVKGYPQRNSSIDGDCHTLSREHQFLGIPVPAFGK